jgi:hypothetical protein
LGILAAAIGAQACDGCRSRDDAGPARGETQTLDARDAAAGSEVLDASMQRPLPFGMLHGGSDGSSAPGREGAAAGRLHAARGVTTGEWFELQPAAPGDAPSRTVFGHFRSGSLFLSLDAMTLLHGAFARALPGFDAFAPHLLDPAALRRLRTELAAFAETWTRVTTAAAAREAFPTSPLVRSLQTDDDWRAARAALAATIEEIARFAAELEAKGAALWVLGTS